MRRATKISAAAAGLAVLAATGTAVAAANHSDNHWPYAQHSAASYTLAAVGDIACEPDDDENATTPTSLKCGSPTLGGMSAEFATAKQATDMHPDAVALLGDEQYQVGKLTDFEKSFEQAWGGLKMLERPAPGNHEYYPYAKKGDNEAGQNGVGYFGYFNGHDQAGTPVTQGQAGDDTDDNQGGTPTTSATGTSSRSMLNATPTRSSTTAPRRTTASSAERPSGSRRTWPPTSVRAPSRTGTRRPSAPRPPRPPRGPRPRRVPAAPRVQRPMRGGNSYTSATPRSSSTVTSTRTPGCAR